ncbi:hypothetical protein [Halarchaeum grantii]|nr:hypothetical protein [Halarchaeum grantii]
MSHTPEEVARYVCDNCQLIHAGAPSRTPAGKRRFEPPAECGGCGADEFVGIENWIHHRADE